MESFEFKDTVCRVCLDENVVIDWNNTLIEYDDVTYKDCYFKYTQLKEFGDDPFSSMLCETCANCLENIHSLIIKALDSYNFLIEVNCMNISTKEESQIVQDDENYESTDFETVLVEKVEPESVMLEKYEYESYDDISVKSEDEKLEEYLDTEEMQYHEVLDTENEQEEYESNHSNENNMKDDNSKFYMETRNKSKTNTLFKRKLKEEPTSEEENSLKKPRSSYRSQKDAGRQNVKSENKRNGAKCKSVAKGPKGKTKRENSQNTPRMCSYCSKILHNKYGLRKHEKTHLENRERKAPCPICGVKFLEESYVKIHMQIHNQDRVKKHKCEFCDKAFFEKGSLNVHRRIHLGQMIPCTLCSKEFFRQVDLDIHMNSHSASLINVETKKRSRYLVHCKYCNKDIMSTSFKSHTAAHLNEPQMKCSICGREFFRRDSCTEHLKTIHKKTTEEYSDFIIIYNKNRLSHLYLEQTTELKK